MKVFRNLVRKNQFDFTRLCLAFRKRQVKPYCFVFFFNYKEAVRACAPAQLASETIFYYCIVTASSKFYMHSNFSLSHLSTEVWKVWVADSSWLIAWLIERFFNRSTENHTDDFPGRKWLQTMDFCVMSQSRPILHRPPQRNPAVISVYCGERNVNSLDSARRPITHACENDWLPHLSLSCKFMLIARRI